MDDLVPSWDACQVDMGCWPDHGQRNRHFTTSWAQINWHRAKVSVKGIIMDIMVLFDRFLQTLGLWPSLAITGFCGASDLRWWWGFRDLAMSPCDTAELNWTPKLQTSYFFDSEGMREKIYIKKKKTYVCYIMIISWADHDHMMILWLYELYGYII